MRERTVYISGDDIRDLYGLVYSSFTEELPEPKVTKVDIPGGSDLDITEAVGFVAYHNGTHTLKFLLYGDTQQDRLDQLRALTKRLHGQYLEYELSWVPGYTFKGRWTVDVDHKFDNADVVTLTVDRYPWRTGTTPESIDINSHPVGTATLEGSTYYDDVSIVTRATSTDVTIGTTQVLDDGAAGTHQLMETVYGDNLVTVEVDDWLMYLDGTNLVVKPSKFSMSGTNAVIDASYTLTNGDMVFPDEAKQHSTLTYTRRDT